MLSAYKNHAIYIFVNDQCVHSGNYTIPENIAAIATLNTLHALNVKHTLEENIYTDRNGIAHKVLEITTEQTPTTASAAIPCL